MAEEFEVPRGTAQGTSTQTILIDESRDLGYTIYTMQTALERLYLITYGWGTPPVGYKDYAKGGIYFDSKDGKIYKMIGTHLSSLWGELGGAGGGVILDQWLQLTDTPFSYTGFEGYGVRVNAGGTGIEFYELPGECEVCFTQDDKDKLDGIADSATNTLTPVNNCLQEVPLVVDVDTTNGPIAISGISGNSVSVIVDNIADNGEYKSIYNDYRYATAFNSGSNDVLSGVSIKLDLLNSPDGELEVSIYSSNTGVPNTLLTSGIVQVNTLVNGENRINFADLPVSINTEYLLVVGVNLNTTGTIKWLETAGGISTVMNPNDEWVSISSNLTHQIHGYLNLPNTGGFGPLLNGDGCFFGIATTDGVNGGNIVINTCGEICGYTGLAVGSKYYLANDGGITLDMNETSTMVGYAVSSTCIRMHTGCGVANTPDSFTILTEGGDDITTESGDDLDHSVGSDGSVV